MAAERRSMPAIGGAWHAAVAGCAVPLLASVTAPPGPQRVPPAWLPWSLPAGARGAASEGPSAGVPAAAGAGARGFPAKPPSMPVGALALAEPGAASSDDPGRVRRRDAGWAAASGTAGEAAAAAAAALQPSPQGTAVHPSAILLGGSPNGGLSADGAEPLRMWGRHVHSEAGRVASLVAAQLLLALARQRRARHAGDGDGDAAAADAPFAPWRHLRLPWQRASSGEGGAGGGGARGAGGGGDAAWAPSVAARRWVAQGVAAERALDLRTALACYTNAVALEPTSPEYLCRLAKQWSDLTYEPGADTAQIEEANANGIKYAERAVALAPREAGGYLAMCVSQGRLALVSDNKTKVRLAKEAREAAVLALQLEPSNDLAHHLMGRWHFEMAQINFVVRQLVRLVYGAALAPGTFADALSEFRAAAELNPTKLIHRVEYGRTLLRLGHKAEALAQLRQGVALEVEDVNAQLQKEDAELLVARLESELARSITWGFPDLSGGGGGGGGGAADAAGGDSGSGGGGGAAGAAGGDSGSGGGGGAAGAAGGDSGGGGAAPGSGASGAA